MERKGSRVVAWLLLVAALGALVVFCVRVSSWSSCWRWSIAEGRESPVLYAFWRLLHGHDLYEWPTRPPYSISFYNFGFYEAYVSVLRAFGVDGERLLFVPRLLTLLGAALGALGFVRLGAELAPPRDRTGWMALGALGFVVWFGTQFVSWWVLSVRPDIWAVGFALAGLGFALRRERSGPGGLAVASLLFFLAWSFKQSCILTFLGLMLGLAVARRFRDALVLGAPFFVLVAAALVLGGDVYRFNVLTAPAASRFKLTLLLGVLGRTLPQNLWMLGFFPLAFWFTGEGPRLARFRALSLANRQVIGAALVAMAFGVVAFGREGSNKNQLFEGYVLAALASWSAWSRARESMPAPVSLLGALLALPLALFPLLQLSGVRGSGRLVLCGEGDARELERMARAVAALPKPLFSDEEVWALPWNSSDNRYPAMVIDSTWYGVAERQHLVPPGFVASLLASGRFRSALVPELHPVLDVLRAQGVPCSELAPKPFGLRFVGCVLPAQPAR
ncbi:MAG TPA: hypothetical protein VFV94_07295 [Polyangiaceae bacterium]|nr:hypothetical protein [Polyangiaceae bacterium]